MAPKKTSLLIILLCLVAIGLSVWAYPLLPEQVASHWGIDGQANGYSSRALATLLMPGMMVGLALLLKFLPRLDPLRANVEQFRNRYNRFIIALLLFFLIIHALTLAWNLGYKVSFNVVLPVAIGGLMYSVGTLCQHSKRNWFIGVRTPWTMSSDAVWDATNQRAGILFKACGVIAILSALIPTYSFWFIIVPILATAIYTVVYSYVVYRRQTGR